jgi:glycosyltransferase involved in cell wall biosynthesis
LKISIITVAFNSEDTVLQALKSVATQKFVDLEYIFIDGGSTDSTKIIAQSYSNLINHFISEPDNGIYSAINKGLRIATGDVIGILNSDDFYARSDVLREVMSIFESDPTLDIVMGGVDFFNNILSERVVRKISSMRFEPWMLRFGFMPPHPAVFIKKSAYDQVGYYNEKYRVAADFDYFIRLFLIHKVKFTIIDTNLVRMRTGGVSTSGWKSKKLITQEMLIALRENNFSSCTALLLFRLPIKFLKQVIL